MTDLIPNDLGNFDGNTNLDDLYSTGQCYESYNHDGLCPICGGYVRTIGGNYDNDPMHDECDTCGWTGEVQYD